MEGKKAEGLQIAFTQCDITKSDKRADMLFNSLLSILVFLGLGGAIYQIFSPIGYIPLLSVSGVIIILFVNACFSYNKTKWGIIFPVLSIALLWISLENDAVNGFLLTTNQIFAVLGKSFGRIFPVYGVTVPQSNYMLSSTVFLVIVIILLGFYISYFVRKGHWIVSFLLFASMALLFSLFGSGVSLIWYVFPFCILALLYLKHGIFSGWGGAKHKAINWFSAGLFPTLFCVLILCIFFLSGFAAWYQGKGWFYGVKDAVMLSFDHIRYDKEKTNSLPQGNLSEASDLVLTDTPALEVSMSKPESLYLRGYVGSVYTGKGWKAIDNEILYENEDLFYWLHESSFYGQTQLAHVAELLDSGITEEDKIKVTVKNLQASSKYIYAPYETYSVEPGLLAADRIGDISFLSTGITGNRRYSYTALPNQVKRYTSLESMLYETEQANSPDMEQYLRNESYYRKFIYENYTQLPETTRRLLSRHLGEYDTGGDKHLPYYNAKQNILSYLTAYTKYSTSVAPAEGEQDFVQQFIEQTRAGYSIHYATAAALMFRYYGIPARYIEGYLITPQDVDGLPANSTITVDGKRAHAWVEIYQDGIGWVPFETTPPYLDIMEQEEDIKLLEDYKAAASQEKTKPKKAAEKRHDDFASSLAISIFLTAVLFLLLAALIISLLRRKAILAQRLHSFELDDRNEAIQNIFAYSMDLLIAMGLVAQNGSLYRYAEEISDLLGESYTEKFTEVVDIHQEARFSANRMTEEHRLQVMEFMKQILLYLIKNTSLIKKFSLRVIQCLY